MSSVSAVVAEPDDAVAALAGSMTIPVPLADLINPQEEVQKLESQLEKLKDERQRVGNKLENNNFIDRAPAAIVQKERDKLSDIDTAAARLTEQLERTRKLIKGPLV